MSRATSRTFMKTAAIITKQQQQQQHQQQHQKQKLQRMSRAISTTIMRRAQKAATTATAPTPTAITTTTTLIMFFIICNDLHSSFFREKIIFNQHFFTLTRSESLLSPLPVVTHPEQSEKLNFIPTNNFRFNPAKSDSFVDFSTKIVIYKRVWTFVSPKAGVIF